MGESFQHRMQQYAPQPPQGVWEDIEAALEAELNGQPLFAQNLQQHTEVPPAGAWAKINAQLEARAARVVPFSWKPYAAAAAIALVLASGYFLNLQKSPTGVSPVVTQSALPAIPGFSKPGDVADGPDQPAGEEVNPVAVTRTGNPSNGTATFERRRPSLLRRLAQLDEPAGENEPRFAPPEAASYSALAFDAAERYMVYSDEDGNALRVPRHLFDYLSCVKKEPDCRQRVASLRAQLAGSTLSTDFTGVLEMLSGLTKNQ